MTWTGLRDFREQELLLGAEAAEVDAERRE